MRYNEFEIEGPSDELLQNAQEKRTYRGRSLPNILEEVETKYTSNYNRILVKYRDPTIELPQEDSTLYKLFSIFIIPYILNQVALFKADRWQRDPSKPKRKYTRLQEDTDSAEIGTWIGIRLLMGLERAVTY